MPMGDDNGPFAGETAILKEAITPTKINYGYKAMLVTVLETVNPYIYTV